MAGRDMLAALLVALFALLLPAAASAQIQVQGQAQEPRYFRIGTGSTAGTYFPIGTIIASAISGPVGLPCPEGRICGVPGLVAVAQTTAGSAQNIELIVAGQLESGFSQADIAHWADRGEAMFKGKGTEGKLRSIASLYRETVHFVVLRSSGIERIGQLRGKRISVGAPGSGTQIDARLILSAYGLKERSYKAIELGPGRSADMLRAGEIDALVIVGGYPLPAITDLAERQEIQLLPIEGKSAEDLIKRYPFFSHANVPESAYRQVPAVATLGVAAQWLVSAEVEPDLVYQITRALWSVHTRNLLDEGHPKGKLIRLETALEGISVPLHEGAARYYKEAGVLD